MKFTRLAGSLVTLLMLGCATGVEGVVRDADTNQPIPGAMVQIGDESTATDSRGFYKLDASSDDRRPQVFHVAAPGYMARSEERVLTGNPDPATIDFNLQPSNRERLRTGEPRPEDQQPQRGPDARQAPDNNDNYNNNRSHKP
jgi:hypothetical protein